MLKIKIDYSKQYKILFLLIVTFYVMGCVQKHPTPIQQLMELIKIGTVEQVESFLNEHTGIDINDEVNMKSPLIVAIEEKNDEICEFLIKRGSNVNGFYYFKDDSVLYPVILTAIQQNLVQIVKLIIEKLPDDTWKIYSDFCGLPLIYFSRSMEMTSILLDNSVEYDLFTASFIDDSIGIDLLISRRDESLMMDHQKKIPFFYALKYERKNAIEKLISTESLGILTNYGIKLNNFITDDYILQFIQDYQTLGISSDIPLSEFEKTILKIVNFFFQESDYIIEKYNLKDDFQEQDFSRFIGLHQHQVLWRSFFEKDQFQINRKIIINEARKNNDILRSMLQNSIASTIKAYSSINDNKIGNENIRTAMIKLWIRVAYQSAVIRANILKLKKRIDYTIDSTEVFYSVLNTQPRMENEESIMELYEYYQSLLKQITEDIEGSINTHIRENLSHFFWNSKLYQESKSVNSYISILDTANAQF
ncbi:MAG: hypothetical protein JXR48_06935 [Candidatus Delongbacteria bacterium]|nr:hypothetical protein [Candidatus Delongbacteria bacterium]